MSEKFNNKVMKKIEFTKEEIAAIEARSARAKAEFSARQKSNPQPITSQDVARIMGMDEDMISELFGEADVESIDDNINGDSGIVPDEEDEI